MGRNKRQEKKQQKLSRTTTLKIPIRTITKKSQERNPSCTMDPVTNRNKDVNTIRPQVENPFYTMGPVVNNDKEIRSAQTQKRNKSYKMNQTGDNIAVNPTHPSY